MTVAGFHFQSDTSLSQQASAKPTADQQPSSKLNQEEELLYENDYSANNTLEPSTEYSYTVVTRSGQLCTKADPKTNSMDFELNSCVAYGVTA